MAQRQSPRAEVLNTAHPSDPDVKTYRTIRFSVLIGTLLVLAIGGTALYFWHDFQKKRGAAELLALADDLIKQANGDDQLESYSEAASLLFRYTQILPEDTQAQIQLAEVYEKTVSNAATVQRATALLNEAIEVAEGDQRNELRRSLIEMLLKQRDFFEAAAESDKLVSSDKKEDRFANLRLRARAYFGRYQSGDIPAPDFAAVTNRLIDTLRDAVAIDPDPELVESLAFLLEADDPRLVVLEASKSKSEPASSEPAKPDDGQPSNSGAEQPRKLTREERMAEAKSLIDDMVVRRPDDAIAHLVRYHYYRQQDQSRSGVNASDNEQHLAKALELGAKNTTVLLYAGNDAYTKAVEILRDQKLTSLPSPTEIPADMPADQKAAIEQARQQYQNAVTRFQQALDLDPTSSNALLGLGQAHVALGDLDAAATLWKNALAQPREDQLALHFYLTQLEIQRERWTEAQTVMGDLNKDLDKLNLRSDRNQFEPLRRTVALMHARILMAIEDYAAALPLLERVMAGQPTSDFETAEKSQAYRLAGLCHERLGRPDMAARAFDNSARLASKPDVQAVAYAAAAEAWESSAVLDNAIAAAEQAVKLDPAPETLLLQARLLAAQQATLPHDQQKWDRFNATTDKLRAAEAAGQLNSGWRLQFLLADVQVLQASGDEQTQKALDHLYQTARDAEQKFPEDQPLLRRLINVYEQLKHPEDADRALRQFQSVNTDLFTQKAAEAALRFDRRQFPEALACLDAIPAASLSKTQTADLAKTRARVLAASGKIQEAADLLKTTAETFPEDLSIAGLRLELVDQLQDTQARAELEAELLGSGHVDKSWAQVLQIQRLIEAAQSERDPGLLEALDLLGRLQTARPEWSVVHALRGAAEEKRASFTRDEAAQRSILELAARAYRQAVTLGDRTRVAQERLINALYRTGQREEVLASLAQIKGSVPFSQILSEIAINIAMDEKRMDEALAMASEAMQARPNDSVARVWYGLVLLNSGQIEAAERAMLEALQAAPQDDQVWNGLFTLYVRTGDKVKARETLEKMLTQANMSPERRASVKAQAFESLEDDAQADAAYREAYKSFPENERIRTRLVEFYGNRLGSTAFDAKPVIAVLEDIKNRYPNDLLAQRTLRAMQLSVGGDAYRDALIATSGQDVADRRMQAYMLVQRDGADNLAKAKEIIEKILQDRATSVPDDRLLLARILDRQGKAPAAREILSDLSRQQPPNLSALFTYLDFLLRQRDLPEAERAFASLEQAAGSAFNIGVLELKARLLVAQNKGASAAEQIDPVLQRQFDSLTAGQLADKRTLAGLAGDLYARVNLYAPAETWYRKLLGLNPEQIAPLATCLAKMGRVSDALGLCESALPRLGAPAVASTVADVLTSGKPTTDDHKRAEPLLAAALQADGNNPSLLLSIANVRLVQGRVDDAVVLLEKVVQLNPRNVLALNNLAMILSEAPEGRSKAIAYIDQAIDITGPRPDLYDTKAAILLYDKRVPEALELLEFAAVSDPTNPMIQFHLAAAYMLEKKDPEQISTRFRAALDAGLENQVLTQSDRELMTSLQSLLPTNH